MTQQRRSPEGQPREDQDDNRPSPDAGREIDGRAAGRSSGEAPHQRDYRGNNARTGGTWRAEGGDSGKLAPAREILSDRNGPSHPVRGTGSKRF